MRVLVVVPRFVPTPGEYYSFPLGLAYVTSALKQAGHQVFGLNLNHQIGQTEQLVADAVRAHGAEACMTGSLSVFLSEVKCIFVGARRGNEKIVNIAGGGVVSSDPEVSLQVMDIDYGVVGEGEVPSCELLDALQRGADPGNCKGIVYRNRKGEIVQTDAPPSVMDLTKFAWPDYEALGFPDTLHLRRPLDNYSFQALNKIPRPVDMISSRSCPYSCTFCFHPVGKVYRERPLDEFFSELRSLIAKYQINMVGIIDELFSLRRVRLLEFCERIKPLGLSWLVQLHPHSVDEEILTAMHDSGCSYISYGVESMSPTVLVSMQKKSKRPRIVAALQQTYDAKIGIQGNLIFGDSAETLETANESMRWWAHNRKFQVNLTRLQVYPGSPDYIVAVRDGMIPDRVAYANELPIYLNISNMNNDNLDGVSFQVDIHHRSLLNVAPVIKFARSRRQVEGRDTAYNFAWRCPRCELVNRYKKCVLGEYEGRKSIRVLCRSCRSRWDIQNFATYGKATESSPILNWVKKRALSLPGSIARGMQCVAGFEQRVRSLLKRVAEHMRSVAGFKKLVRYALRRVGLLLNRLFGNAFSLLGKITEGVPSREGFKPPAGPLLEKISEWNSTIEMRHAGLAVAADPFDPARHARFAETLAVIGALGAARLHLEQALSLAPRSAEFAEKLAALKRRPDYAAKGETYFVSFSDAPPLYRPSREAAHFNSKREPAFPVYSRAGNRESIYSNADAAN